MVAPLVVAAISALSPLVQDLFSKGLGLLGNAVIAKGQDVIEKELGVKIENTSPEVLAKLQMEKEEFLLKATLDIKTLEAKTEQIAQENVTERWKLDMLSDSRLSKNIRPGVLIYLLTLYTAFAAASAFEIQVTQAYVELLAQMVMLVMSAYFVGRTVEKVIDMKERGKYNVSTD